MLVQFSVENFLSFQDEVIFSMVADSADRQHPSHLILDEASKGGTLLRAAAIYGANAAGKSNLVQAMRFAENLILNGTRRNQTIPVKPFKLALANSNKSSKFEFLIKTQGTLYNYGFRLDSTRILEEWLFATPKKNEAMYFQRIAGAGSTPDMEFGRTLTGKGKQQQPFLEFIARGTRHNQLFLTEAVAHNVSELEPVIKWFNDVLLIISAEQQMVDLEIRAHKSTKLTDFLGNFLRVAGTGIDSVKTEEVEFNIDKHLSDAPDSVRATLRERISNLKSNGIMILEFSDGKRYIIRQDSNNQPKLVTIHMQHRAEHGDSIIFGTEEESEGTQRLIHLVPALFSLKQDTERVIVLDELDRRLHPLLSRLFVRAALDCDEDHKQSQLIFTTHDTNLLDLDLLRRDEIWFVEKDAGGASNTYSLAEFKIRPDLKIEKGYLNGRFGAIPFIGDIKALGWMDLNENGYADVSPEILSGLEISNT